MTPRERRGYAIVATGLERVTFVLHGCGVNSVARTLPDVLYAESLVVSYK